MPNSCLISPHTRLAHAPIITQRRKKAHRHSIQAQKFALDLKTATQLTKSRIREFEKKYSNRLKTYSIQKIGRCVDNLYFGEPCVDSLYAQFIQKRSIFRIFMRVNEYFHKAHCDSNRPKSAFWKFLFSQNKISIFLHLIKIHPENKSFRELLSKGLSYK